MLCLQPGVPKHLALSPRLRRIMATGRMTGESASNWKRPPTGHKDRAQIEDPPSHLHNSQAHLALAKRRHDHLVEHPQKTTAAHPSHHSHFFKSPQPKVGDMYPVGASFTAKHCSDEFARKAYDVYSQVGTNSSAGRGRSEAESCTFTDILAAHNPWEKEKSPRKNKIHVTRPKDFTRNWESAHRHPPRQQAPSVYCSTRSDGSGARFRPPPRSEVSMASSDTGHGHDYRGIKPMDPKAYEPHPLEDKQRFFISQQKLQKAKCQHKTALKVDHDRWARIECGSHGHSAEGSDFGSVCHKPAARPRTAR